MTPIQTFLATALALLSLGTLAWLIARPSLRLRQVGRFLRESLEDPTREKEWPRALNPIGAELSALRDRLIQQQEEVRQQERRRQELIAFLAHDLKTPLTSVMGYLELLWNEPDLDREQRVKYTGIALDKARRLEELVGEFFDINTMELRLEHHDPIQISFLLEQLADEFYPLFAAKGLRCTPDIQPHLVVAGEGERVRVPPRNCSRLVISSIWKAISRS